MSFGYYLKSPAQWRMEELLEKTNDYLKNIKLPPLPTFVNYSKLFDKRPWTANMGDTQRKILVQTTPNAENKTKQ